jgi:uncharacterized membrane protein (DUF2068 family)
VDKPSSFAPAVPGPASGAAAPPGVPAPARLDGLRIIALLKYGKALLFLATTYGVDRLLDPATVERLRNFTASVTDRVDRRLLERALTWVQGLDANRMHLVIAATTLYAVLAGVEGTGLWLRRSWGQWFTVTATASLMPFELWEWFQRGSGHRLPITVTLLVNALIVWYLVRRLRVKRARLDGALK